MDTIKWLLEGENIKQKIKGPCLMLMWVLGWTIMLLGYAIFIIISI